MSAPVSSTRRSAKPARCSRAAYSWRLRCRPRDQGQYVQVQGPGPVGPGLVADQLLDHQESGARRRRSADRPQNIDCLGVWPVVDHLHQQIGITDRQRVREEVAGLQGEALRGQPGNLLDDRGQLEQDTARGGHRVKDTAWLTQRPRSADGARPVGPTSAGSLAPPEWRHTPTGAAGGRSRQPGDGPRFGTPRR
jgi:hypothetical protein